MDTYLVNEHRCETMNRIHRVNVEAQAMWFEAHKAIEEAQKMRRGLKLQIEELAKRDGFRLRYRDKMLAQILDDAVAYTHADMGNIQVLDARRLVIRVHQGFRAQFVDFFNDCPSRTGGLPSGYENPKPDNY